jgi:beta-amylase
VPAEGAAASPLLAVPVPGDEPDDDDHDAMDGGDRQTGLATCPAPLVAPPRPPERDFAGTPYVPVYVMLPVCMPGVTPPMFGSPISYCPPRSTMH